MGAFSPIITGLALMHYSNSRKVPLQNIDHVNRRNDDDFRMVILMLALNKLVPLSSLGICEQGGAIKTCQVIFSMADEYVPDYVDKKTLVERLCRAMGGAEKVEIEWGNHSLSNRVHEAVNAVLDFVRREGPKGWDDPWS